MLTFRRFLERSRRFSIDISLPISKGIDPVSKLSSLRDLTHLTRVVMNPLNG